MTGEDHQLCCDWLCFSITNFCIQIWGHTHLLVAAINVDELDIEARGQPQNVSRMSTVQIITWWSYLTVPNCWPLHVWRVLQIKVSIHIMGPMWQLAKIWHTNSVLLALSAKPCSVNLIWQPMHFFDCGAACACATSLPSWTSTVGVSSPSILLCECNGAHSAESAVSSSNLTSAAAKTGSSFAVAKSTLQ